MYMHLCIYMNLCIYETDEQFCAERDFLVRYTPHTLTDAYGVDAQGVGANRPHPHGLG